VTVAPEAAEEARATMLRLFPEGFEEVAQPDAIELAAYTGAEGEETLRTLFDTVSSTPVAAGWEDRWRSFHRPVRVGPLWVGPPWEVPPSGAVAVVVDPGRAFGTGAHPTTRLTLELLLGLEPSSLLDLGCGSGVLAIAAAKLGFAPVSAVDVDPVAVEATVANAERNGVDVDAKVADALTESLPAVAVAVANISLELVEAVLPRLHARAVVTSGYLDSQQPSLTGLEHVERCTEIGWAADLYRAK
jgi:ribosomal protein L11 methyltransferase